MKITVEIDTAHPPAADRLEAEARYLLWISQNLPDFLKNAPTTVEGVQTAFAAAPLPDSPATGTDVATGDNNSVRDSRGIKHDPAIHTRTQSKDANGAWKAKSGVDAAVVAAAEAAQFAALGLPVPGAATAPPPPPAGNVPPPPPAATPPAPPAPPAPNAPPPPPAAATPPAPPAAGASSIQLLSGLVGTGQETSDGMLASIRLYGGVDMSSLVADPALANNVVAYYRSLGKLA